MFLHFLPSLTAEKAQHLIAGLCLFLFLIREHQDRIHMPRGFVDDPEGDVADEKVDSGVSS